MVKQRLYFLYLHTIFISKGPLWIVYLLNYLLEVFADKNIYLVFIHLSMFQTWFSNWHAFSAVWNHVFLLYRQSGLGYCSFLGLIGGSVSPLIMVLEEVWPPLPSIIFSLLAFAAALSAFSLSETQNVRLPEGIEDVEQTRYFELNFEVVNCHNMNIMW